MNEKKENGESGKLSLFRVIISWLCWLIPTILTTLIVGWFAIWQGIEFIDYNWVYSDVNTVRATQYLLHVLWGVAFSISPFWWLGSIALIVIALKPE